MQKFILCYYDGINTHAMRQFTSFVRNTYPFLELEYFTYQKEDVFMSLYKNDQQIAVMHGHPSFAYAKLWLEEKMKDESVLS